MSATRHSNIGYDIHSDYLKIWKNIFMFIYLNKKSSNVCVCGILLKCFTNIHIFENISSSSNSGKYAAPEFMLQKSEKIEGMGIIFPQLLCYIFLHYINTELWLISYCHFTSYLYVLFVFFSWSIYIVPPPISSHISHPWNIPKKCEGFKKFIF